METLDLERAEFVLDRTPADKKKVDLAMIWMLEQMAKLQEMAFLMDERIEDISCERTLALRILSYTSGGL
ncbi:hypothetical protein M8J76_001000 [Diaphorina citri]|nr:hypothetical protein M8J76_001000 [Diaphorina citri]KAI5718176.1 hypothetical protein M8J77_017475 [Diaphorina citri]